LFLTCPMINVIVVPEKEKFIEDVSHENIVWINKALGTPNLKGRNAKYLVPFWCTDENRGAKRIYHILDIEDNEITLGNSFIIEKEWNKMGQYRKFEYHSLESFNFVEVKDGFLIPYDFEK